MPTFSFLCSSCNLKFDRHFASSDKVDVTCPSCSSPVTKLPPENLVGKIAESTSIPKEIDLMVGKDAEKKWQEYEDRKKEKEQIKSDFGTEKLSRDLDGSYTPLEIIKDGVKVDEKEAIQLRKEMYSEFEQAKKENAVSYEE